MTRGRKDPAEVLEDILGEADGLIRRRLEEVGLELPHVVLAVTPDNKIVLPSNVSANVLRSFGQDLQDVAEELTAPPKQATQRTSRSARDRAPACWARADRAQKPAA